MMPIKARSMLLDLLESFDKIARKHNLEYWMTGGTLLGAVRNGSFVPWDDDIDVAVPSDSLQRLLHDSSVHETMGKMGYTLEYADFIYRFWKIGRNPPYMDVFEYEREAKGTAFRVEGAFGFLGRTELDMFQLRSCHNRHRWPREYYLVSELFPLKDVALEGLPLRAPANPHPYLGRAFGRYLTWRLPKWWPTGQPEPELRGRYWRIPSKTHTHDINWDCIRED